MLVFGYSGCSVRLWFQTDSCYTVIAMKETVNSGSDLGLHFFARERA